MIYYYLDLMIPGLVLGPEGKLPDLKAGDLVAITIKGYPYVTCIIFIFASKAYI